LEEGGYFNDAHDPGGMTMEDIIQKEYDPEQR
jgi:lysozyme family protein